MSLDYANNHLNLNKICRNVQNIKTSRNGGNQKSYKNVNLNQQLQVSPQCLDQYHDVLDVFQNIPPTKYFPFQCLKFFKLTK